MTLRGRLSYANVTATIALALALAGGTALAAERLVTSKQQLARGVVTNGKVAKQTLKVNRLREGAREKLRGDAGPAGPAGERGPEGPEGLAGAPGAQGEPGATDVRIRITNISIPPGGTASGTAPCEPGERAVGGGIGLTNGIPAEFVVWSTRPVDAAGDSTAGNTPAGWRASAHNASAGPANQSARVYAVCAAG